MSNFDLDRTTKVFFKLYKYYPSVIIAGGCPRDLHQGKPITDVDFFIRVSSDRVKNEILLRSLLGVNKHNKCFTCTSDTPEAYRLSSVVKSTYTYDDGNVKYDFVFMTMAPASFVYNYFDFGLCMQYFYIKNGMLKHHLVSDATKDIQDKTCTLLVRDTLPEQSIGKAIKNHWPRIHAKYPDYKLKVRYVE